MSRNKSAKRPLKRRTKKLARRVSNASCERLEAENAELRRRAADLALAIHTLCYPLILFDHVKPGDLTLSRATELGISAV
jgi:hypothetical protein